MMDNTLNESRFLTPLHKAILFAESHGGNEIRSLIEEGTEYINSKNIINLKIDFNESALNFIKNANRKVQEAIMHDFIKNNLEIKPQNAKKYFSFDNRQDIYNNYINNTNSGKNLILTPIHLAIITAKNDDYSSLSLLLGSKEIAKTNGINIDDINLNIKDDDILIPVLHFLIIASNERAEDINDIINEYFINNPKVDINLKDNIEEMTPLHCAVITKNKGLVGTLIKDNDLVINEPDKKGKTPLHYAVELGNKEIVEILLKKEAENILKNKSNIERQIEILNNIRETSLTKINDEILSAEMENVFEDFENKVKSSNKNCILI